MTARRSPDRPSLADRALVGRALTGGARTGRRPARRTFAVVAAATGLVLLAGCQQAQPGDFDADAPATGESASGDGHGAIAGARELTEPALHLTTIGADGEIEHLDLLDESSETLGEIAPADRVDSDGRFLFAGRDGEVSIVDSGVWTWNHVDHFHYYEAPSRIIGELTGDGTPQVVISDLGAGVSFDGAGGAEGADGGGSGDAEAVLLDFEALKKGEIVESFRVEIDAQAGMVVPLPTGALVTDAAAGELRHLDADGTELGTLPCTDPAGSIATNVGVVVGCADAAVLAVSGAEGTTFERIAYPADATDRAVSFAAREGRPTVAGLTGGSGIWLLDTRERTWSRIDAGEPVVRASAVDGPDEHVVALAADGAVLVLSGVTGERLARTEPLVAASLADPALAGGVTLAVDQNRTYLNGPAENLMFELDIADGARIARSFDAPHSPRHLVETGR